MHLLDWQDSQIIKILVRVRKNIDEGELLTH